MNFLATIRPGQQLNDLFGGTPKELLNKVFFASIAILWSIANSTAYLLFLFLLLLIIDAVFGAILAHRNGSEFNGWRFIAGPSAKLVITALAMMALAVMDNLLANTKLGALVDQPLVIGLGGAICLAMGVDCLIKYGQLTGKKWVATFVRAWFGRFIPK